MKLEAYAVAVRGHGVHLLDICYAYIKKEGKKETGKGYDYGS